MTEESNPSSADSIGEARRWLALLQGQGQTPLPSGSRFIEPRPAPRLLPRRNDRAAFVVRVDLDDVKPPIWRRLRLASDLTLDELHEVMQTAMGWTDSHLHHFQMGPDEKNFRMLPFLTPFDLEEGDDEGLLEADVRLDEVIAAPGHRLFHEYDFGDGRHHPLKLERVEPWRDDDPVAHCLTGRRACPPEDVGGPWGYTEVLDALNGTVEPDNAEWMAEKLAWMPDGFDPAAFDVDQVNALLDTGSMPDLYDWSPELALLVVRTISSPRGLQSLLNRALAGWVEPEPELIAGAVSRYQHFMRLVGGGLRLTAAGYLPPAVVERLVADLDLEIEFVGKGNREDYTMPVYHLRESATALGLVRKSKGVLSITKAGQKVVDDPVGLLSHIRSRLPLGREFERDAGLLALLVTAAGQSWRQHHDAATPIYRDLGWHDPGGRLDLALWHGSRPTLDVLEQATGRWGPPEETATIARLLLRP